MDEGIKPRTLKTFSCARKNVVNQIREKYKVLRGEGYMHVPYKGGIDNTYVVHDCKAIRESDKAILVTHNDWDTPQWFPKSQITDDSEVYKDNTEGVLIISMWIAKQKGIVK